MYFVKTPKILSSLFSDILWECPEDRLELHLSFDDSPSQNTPYILDALAKYNHKASFFCLGRQIEKHPDLFERIQTEGHLIGNHGYAHLNGWRTPFKEYIKDLQKGFALTKSSYFRPPFGRLTPRQYQYIKEHHQIVMWTIMPGDFDSSISENKVVRRMAQAKPKDIIVLHDNDSIQLNWQHFQLPF